MHQFSLDDRAGKAHQYRVEPHPAGVGAALALRVQALATEPLVEVLRTIASAPGLQRLGTALQEGSEQDTTALLADAAGDLLRTVKDLDLSTIGRTLSGMLATKDGPDLVKQILARTWRDGRSLGEPMDFDAAYQANYGEMLRAVFEVVRYNGFFPLADLLQSSAPEPPAKVAPIRRQRSSTASGG